ncbi:cell surface glycoprotein MUC18 isoform X1 [Astyanax mexicanus]|uniref:cell surface glycoprotein MUC18 isoform X1 n=1 Tax=Astyanax mexicanus TaxID=7994 RepID=UPI0020CB1E19|nr:cell surface glycoprotein MUC18 isoform X1 [Astyanax mexicanus]
MLREGCWMLLLVVGVCHLAQDVGGEVNVTMVGDSEVYMGDSAEIRCQYKFLQNASMVMVQWFVRDHRGSRVRISYSDLTMQKVDENTNYTERISVAGDSGGENLTIVDVKLSDEREFFCQVDGLAAGSNEGKFHLRVFDPPEPPVIEAVRYGVSVTSVSPSKVATCETTKGFPQPNITWYRNHKPLHRRQGQVNLITLVSKDSTGLYTVQSELQYKVTREDKDAHFFCEVSYFVPGAVRTVESKSVNISVHYPTTKIEMWRELPEGLVKEGDTVEIRCHGDGNPPPAITFSREQETDLDADDNVLVLKDVTRRDSGIYHCHSLDLDSRSADNNEVMEFLQLTVHYLDPAVVVPRDSEVMLKGENLSASCNALSSLETNTVWFKNGVEIKKGNVLNLQDATFDTAGHYNCEVTVPSIPGLHTSGSVHIIVQGAPQLRDAKREMDVIEKVGKWVNLTCDVRGHPRPIVTWSAPSITGWREVVRRETEDFVQSIVTMKITRDTDVVAVCNATNKLGADTKTYTIRSIPIVTPAARNTADNSGVIIVVIIISILLVAILGSVLYFLYKKGKLPCGRSGKQEIINPFSTKEKTNKDDIVVEMKADKTEKSVLLKGVNGDKKPPSDQ